MYLVVLSAQYKCSRFAWKVETIKFISVNLLLIKWESLRQILAERVMRNMLLHAPRSGHCKRRCFKLRWKKGGKELKLIFHRWYGLQLKTIIKHFDDYWMDNLLWKPQPDAENLRLFNFFSSRLTLLLTFLCGINELLVWRALYGEEETFSSRINREYRFF